MKFAGQSQPTSPRGGVQPPLPSATVITLLLMGLVVTAAFVVQVGWRPIAASLAALGMAGFAIFCAYTLGVFVLLGLAWLVIVPGLPVSHLPALTLTRLLREAGADILPFSQLGGFALGARAATLLGMPSPMSIASSIVDLAAEMVGQLLFTTLGTAIIWRVGPTSFPSRVIYPILGVGLVAGTVTAGLFIVSQRRGLRLLAHFSARWPAAMRSQLSSVQSALADLYRRPIRFGSSAILHFSAWIAATGGVWLVLRLMGTPLSLPAVIGMESLIYLVRSIAFAVPGAIGVLEAGYMVLGPMFGLKPEISLSLSLIKRGRDLALGLPSITIWQVLESKRLLANRASGQSMPAQQPQLLD